MAQKPYRSRRLMGVGVRVKSGGKSARPTVATRRRPNPTRSKAE